MGVNLARRVIESSSSMPIRISRPAPGGRGAPGRALLVLFVAVVAAMLAIGETRTPPPAVAQDGTGTFSLGNLVQLSSPPPPPPNVVIWGYRVREGETLEVTVVRTGGATLAQDVTVIVELQGGIVDVDYPASTKTQTLVFTGGTNETVKIARFQTFNRSRVYTTVCGDKFFQGVSDADMDCDGAMHVVIKNVSHGSIGENDLVPVEVLGRGTPVIDRIFPHSARDFVSPDEGILTVEGRNFSGIFINGSPVTVSRVDFIQVLGGATVSVLPPDIDVVSPTLMRVEIPALSDNFEYDVQIHVSHGGPQPGVGQSPINPGERFVFAAYPRPTVTSLSHRAGPTVGGTNLTIIGTNFGAPGPCAPGQVTVAGVIATSCNVISDTRIEIVTPAAPIGFTGTDYVRVTVGVLQSPATEDNLFTYAGAPKITGISPNVGPASGGTTVQIFGSGFREPSALGQVNSVTFGGNAALSFTVLSDTLIEARTPPLNVSQDTTVQVQVIHPATGASAFTTAANFTYTTGPAIQGLEPRSGPPQGGTPVLIVGSGFGPGASVKFGETSALSVTVESGSRIRAVSPAGSGTVFVVVTFNGRSSPQTPESQFTYNAPEVTRLTPNAGPTAGGTVVLIDGKNFTEGALVRFGQQTVASQFISPEQIRATSPAFEVGGQVDVVVIAAGGESRKHPASVFTYTNGPIIDAVNPTFGPKAGGTVVIITGKEFVAPLKVFFGDQESPAVNVDSKTQITALSPPSPTIGFVDVRVEAAAGKSPANEAARFEYKATPPEVAAVTPATGRTGGGEKVTISGRGFLGAACPGSVLFGTAQAPSCTVIDDTKIEAITPAHPSGKTFVIVRTAGGESAIVENFEFVSGPPGSGGGGGGGGGGMVDIPPTGDTVTYILAPGWNVILWAGADGAKVSDVLANPLGTNLTGVIDAIYILNPDATTNIVFAPGTGREGNTLIRGSLYWFHVRGTEAVNLITVDQ